jgi:hypothetical protein
MDRRGSMFMCGQSSWSDGLFEGPRTFGEDGLKKKKKGTNKNWAKKETVERK